MRRLPTRNSLGYNAPEHTPAIITGMLSATKVHNNIPPHASPTCQATKPSPPHARHSGTVPSRTGRTRRDETQPVRNSFRIPKTVDMTSPCLLGAPRRVRARHAPSSLGLVSRAACSRLAVDSLSPIAYGMYFAHTNTLDQCTLQVGGRKVNHSAGDEPRC